MEIAIDRVEVKKEAKKMLDGKIWILLLCNLCYSVFVIGAGVIVYLIAETPSSILEEILATQAIYNEMLFETVFWFIFFIIFNAIVFPYYVCLTTVSLAIVNNEKITVAKIFAPISKFRYFIEYAIAGVEIYICTYMWSLLLFFPGFIAAYRYRYAHYILATTEDITAGEAIEKSKELTYGNKSQLFVLDLSFIGWVLFGIITCGLGLLFALGYFEVVNAMYYKKIAEAYAAQKMQKKQQESKKEPDVKEAKQEKVEASENKDNKQEMPELPEIQNSQATESTQTQASQE